MSLLSVRCILCFDKAFDVELYAKLLKLRKSTESETGIASESELPKEEIEQAKLSAQVKIELEQGFTIRSSVIARNKEEELTLLGKEILQHFLACHQEEASKIAQLAAQWSGFNVMKYFETEDSDSIFEKEKETMRDNLVEEVMWGASDDEDDELEEDDNEDESIFEDEDDEDEDEEETLETKPTN